MALALAAAPVAAAGQGAVEPPGAPRPLRTGEQVFRDACVACHGAQGRGAPRALVGFDTRLPDFTDCGFATAEADVDWLAVVHRGGPARGFHRMMPAFDEALTDGEIQRVVEYLRGFCPDRSWPRGELNLPRALFTEKAYPEDEVVLTTGVAVHGPGAVDDELVFEKRIAARYQLEVSFPFSFQDLGPGTGWQGGVGDLAVGLKGVLFHSLRSGTILSAATELSAPTGDARRGFGLGTWAAEPYVMLGQMVLATGFAQLQAGAQLPFDTGRAASSLFARGVVGQSFTEGRFGRMWTPMLEALLTRDVASGSSIEADLVPQVQVTLSARRHVMAAVGVRIPVDRSDAATSLYGYLLWDWFDGGLLEGW